MKFIPPASLDAAEQRRTELLAKVQEIQAQLSAEDERLDDLEWRGRAKQAYHLTMAELTHLKGWMKKQRQQNLSYTLADYNVDTNDPISLLRGACYLLHRLAGEGVELNSTEQAMLDACKVFLQERAPARPVR